MNPTSTNKRKIIAIFVAIFAVAALIAYVVVQTFTPPEPGATEEKVFVIAEESTTGETISTLKEVGLIKSGLIFRLIHKGEIAPGGYLLSKGMTTKEISNVLQGEPALVWVTIPEGLRKEEIANILATELDWSEEEERKWVTHYTAVKLDTIEGVYFPDTYLIPVIDSGLEVAERMRHRFDEVFAPFAQEAIDQNIKWTTVVKIASLIQREAAGNDDMPLIAGIIWNRLLSDMKLEIDATVQYAKDTYANYDADDPAWELTYHGNGAEEQGWWSPISPEDKDIDSVANTYLYKGLPSRPIANPSIAAIQAVLFPEETDCIFYLHDPQGNIHCAVTYEEHQVNIDQHLR